MPKKKAYPSRNTHLQKKKSKLLWLWVAGSALVLLIAVFFAFQKKPSAYIPEVTGGPSLKVDKEEVDLGDVKLGSPVKVSFDITNVGDKPLRFMEDPYIEVREGC